MKAKKGIIIPLVVTIILLVGLGVGYWYIYGNDYVFKLNGEKIIEDYAAFANISPTQIVPSDEIEKLRNEIKNSQNQQIQMNALKEGSQIIQNMGGVDSFGSDLLDRFGII